MQGNALWGYLSDLWHSGIPGGYWTNGVAQAAPLSWDGSPRLWLTRPQQHQQHPGSQGCRYRPQAIFLRDDEVLLEQSLWTRRRALWVEGPVGAVKAELPGGAKCEPGLALGYA